MRRGLWSRSIIYALLTAGVCVALSSCRDNRTPPPRGVEALLLSDRSDEDTISPILRRRQAEMLRAFETRDARAADYLTMGFRFTRAGTPDSARGYFDVLSQGLPAEVLKAEAFEVQDIGDEFAGIRARVSSSHSLWTTWTLRGGKWQASYMIVYANPDTMRSGTGPTAAAATQ